MIEILFYQNQSGTEPVKVWLKELTKQDRQIIGTDLKTVQFGWPIGMPTCRPLGNGLYEVRSNITGKNIARVIFFFDGSNIILVNGFIKKTQKTPQHEIDLALKRQKIYNSA